MSGSVTMYRATCGVYWLFLGVWIGAIVMLAITAAVTFRTVGEYQPVLTQAPYNAPELADKASKILAGGVIGNVLKAMAVLQAMCVVVLVFCVTAQCLVFADRLVGGAAGWRNLLRVALLLLPVTVLLADQGFVTPRIWSLRARMYDAAAAPPQRQAAQVEFDRYHRLDENIVTAALASLIAAVAVSAFVLHEPNASPGADTLTSRAATHATQPPLASGPP